MIPADLRTSPHARAGYDAAVRGESASECPYTCTKYRRSVWEQWHRGHQAGRASVPSRLIPLAVCWQPKVRTRWVYSAHGKRALAASMAVGNTPRGWVARNLKPSNPTGWTRRQSAEIAEAVVLLANLNPGWTHRQIADKIGWYGPKRGRMRMTPRYVAWILRRARAKGEGRARIGRPPKDGIRKATGMTAEEKALLAITGGTLLPWQK